MQIGTFRKNVMKTVAVKGSKLGIRTVSRNTNKTNIAHAIVWLKGHVGSLLQVLTPYVLGAQMSAEHKADALVVMGDIAYDLTVLCRVLKVKMPSATKKSKLTGTRTAGLMELDSLATDLLQVMERGTFQSPKLKTIKKVVVLPNKGGAKEERDVEVVDVEAEAKADLARQDTMRSLLTSFVALFWRLTYDTLQAPPVVVIDAKFARMVKDFPDVTFDTSEPKTVEKEAETAVAGLG